MKKGFKKLTSFLMILTFGVLMVAPLAESYSNIREVEATATTNTSKLTTYQKEVLDDVLSKNATTASDLIIWQYQSGSMYVSTNLTGYSNGVVNYSGYKQYTASSESSSTATGNITISDANFSVYYLKYNGVVYYGDSLVKDCATTTYYMEKDWVRYEDFYDKEFTATSLLTDTGVYSNTNMLGTAGYPDNAKLDVLVGSNSYQITSGEHRFFQFTTKADIKVWNFSVDLALYDTSTGKYVPLVIWLNGYKPSGEDITEYQDYEVYDTLSGTGLNTFNLEGKTINAITILPESLTWKSTYRWVLSHFQVDEYAVFTDTGKWLTENPGYETSTKEETYCLSTGSFYPEKSDWAQSATVYYSPSWSEFSYKQYENSDKQQVSWDYCRGNENAAYSTSRAKYCINNENGGGISYGDKVTSVSAADANRNNKMSTNKFEIDEGKTGQYDMYPVHWTNSSSSSIGKYITDSTDTSWCEHVTGSTSRCYKYTNHHGTARYNSWDIDLLTWTSVPDSEKTLAKVVYTLTNNCANGNMNSCTVESTSAGVETENLAQKEFILGDGADITKDGVYKIMAVLTDAGGRTASVEGGPYYIDFTAPEMSITTSVSKANTWLSSDVEVIVRAEDGLSGISHGILRAHNSLTGTIQEEALYNEVSKLTISNKTGIYYVTAYAEDKAGNSASIGSDLIYIDSTAPSLSLSSNQTAGVYTSGNVIVSYSAVDNHSGLQYYVMPDGTKRTNTEDGTYTVTTNGLHTFQVCDNAYPTPNCTSKTIVIDEIDKDAVQVEYIPNSQAWINKMVNVEVKMTDTRSGVKKYDVSVRKLNDDGTYTTSTVSKTLSEQLNVYSHLLVLNETGEYTISTTAYDNVGNVASKASGTYYVDFVTPEINLEFSNNAKTEWSSEDVTVTVTVSDAHSGLNTVTLPDGTKKTFNGAETGTAQFVIKQFGLTNPVTVTDVAGNSKTVYANPLIDKENPDITLGTSEKDNVWTKSADIYYEATDEHSGVAYLILPDGTKKYFTEGEIAWNVVLELDSTYAVLCHDDSATFEILSPTETSLESPYVTNKNIGIVKGTYTSSLLNGTIAWTEQRELKPGYNELVFEPVNCDDVAQFSESVYFYYDNNAPLLKIESHDATTADNPFNAEGVNKITLSGAVNDEIGVASLTINGSPIEYNSNGDWSVEVAIDEGKNEYVLVATDIAGNVTEKRFHTTKTYTNYTISYNVNGGVMPSEYVTKYTAEFEVVLPKPTREHYEFAGWLETNDMDGIPFLKFEKGTRGTKQLIAVWTPIEYDIIYDLNGGTNVSSNPDSYNVETTTFTLQAPTRTGYLFSGWTGTGLSSANKNVTISKGSYGDRNYTATWTPITYYVKYNANGGDGSMATSTHKYDEPSQLSALDFYKNGYVFVGWATSSVGNAIYKNAATVENLTDVSGGTIELFAIWKIQPKTYKIVYKTESNITLGTSELAQDHGVTVTVVPEKFDGYTTPASQSVTWDSDSKTITFIYKPINYPISYVLGGGSVTGNPTSYTIETTSFTLKNPTRTGYTFSGWSGSNGSTPQLSVTVNKGTIGEKVYSANWNANPYAYTVECKSTNGLLLETYTVTYNYDTTNVIAPKDISGYTKPGSQTVTWDVAQDGGKTITFTYSPITYSISYDSNAGLPGGYTLLSYIESTGTQYIDTGYKPSNSTGYEITHSIAANNGRDNIIIGARENSGDTRFWTDIDWSSSTTPTIGWGFTSYTSPEMRYALDSSKVGKVITSSLNHNNSRVTTVDGVAYDTSLSSKTLSSLTKNIYIFAGNNAGTASYFTSAKVYSVKITEGTTLVRDFVPVLNPSGVAGLYDLVNGRFYSNAGTGTFTTGPAASEFIKTYSPEAAVTIPNISRVGYTFAGWTDKDTTTPTTNYVIPQRSYGDRVLKANWTPNAYTYNIVYVTNSGVELGRETITKNYGTTNSIAPKTYVGYDSPANQAIAWDSVTPKTITFVYSPTTYTNIISHVIYGGSTYVEKVIATTTFTGVYGTTVTLGSNLKMSNMPAGVTATHFGSSNSTDNGWTSYNIGDTYTQPARAVGVSLYYTANEYTITYNLNGGTNNASNPSKYTILYGVSFAAPTKAGYTFAGWFLDEEKFDFEKRE